MDGLRVPDPIPVPRGRSVGASRRHRIQPRSTPWGLSSYDAESITYTEAQPFFTTVVLQALEVADRFDLALDIIRSRWGNRMVARGATSTYEEWKINGSWRDGEYRRFLRSLSHAWSAHPAEFLARNLVGFKILEPGYETVGITPRAVDFDYEISVPTPYGPIDVVKNGPSVDVSAPEAVRVEREHDR